MKITDLLKKDGISLNVSAADQNAAIDALIELHEKVGNLNNVSAFKKAILAREEKGSTAIGMGIAVPHGKSFAVSTAGVTAITIPSGIDYKSLDGNPSKLFFMIAAPDTAADTHLEVLSKLMTLLMDQNFSNKLIEAKTPDEFLKIIDEKEAEKDKEEAAKKAAAQAAAPASTTANKKLLGVTACPTGIAHTFMAAEALELKAKEMGLSIKVEKDGSAGAKDVLKASEIEEADAIIIACDKNIDMGRFDGKEVIITSTKEAIHNPEELIKKATSGQTTVYHHTGAVSKQSDVSNESFGRQFYKHLMNGVSHMLPFVIGGGILIAIAFLLDDYSIDPSNFGTNTPVAAWFKTIGGVAFGFMLPILAGFIAQSIADRPGLAVGFVGGALASSGATFAAPGGDVSSAFLGALVAGFAAGYIVKLLQKAFEKLPQALEGIKPVLIYPLCGILMIGLVMCLINPIVGALNTWITGVLEGMGTGSMVVLGILLGAMMATDMGGPLNKAAYAFGLASLANQNETGHMIMAAIMVGGMVPPIAIAFATIFFKKKFTPAERKSGPVNFIMGLSFITEGAIPFAAADPIRVIPSLMVGSGLAGALSMAFKCTLRAPHGGIFVFPVVGNVGMYLVALLVGSAAGCLMLGLLKKNVEE
ncbi:PTS fructose transporter subunit IIABC [Butyrivibrio sp. YAB3001]|uniref:PTS fructose transporter subunit IIABC n=1 Tax=Butyrivibrio sp. YAB3001 TaxID=1520812 RepID=UPI0008F68CC9|nr:fructose-specific PTS transporter subunit EIIC [Butyrivibrio sp. YAB3001]SFB82783.1 PTS system, fructose-specific IIC component [Butyrivibrio sp. YAB3001]